MHRIKETTELVRGCARGRGRGDGCWKFDLECLGINPKIRLDLGRGPKFVDSILYFSQ